MSGFHINIEKETQENENFRKVLFTTPRCQLVVMSLRPLEDIGVEVHNLDQFIRVESGNGAAVLDGKEILLTDGVALIIPEGVQHNIANTSSETPLKLYTIYTPPEHRDGIVHQTKQDAQSDAMDHYENTTGA